ncbi:hypothetical protein Kpol_2002p21 [Vanderwaltozyma polyspora DSM 70294]|uniref:Outer kinetochore KNL1 complex subunit KRE28 n=1 Tax=Vanderwaltozyma polyspora (strain ATCC 22028 / DSM 70294 / BCRC 21397 / CBS 2163 / NBRC 10782 / NRRL Y-8283 / UCD 57-17) TaxID=436907 RepID=ZWINT_VANPO|nr:uncharacterized protein Kpol_2002p21 [Vanderwaltozyma polyspora DSM 70294]A7TFD7.1 RecName: Full=Spindle pole body component KRE28 [Vanderwaltozyma polyspora DSM 70294]EDO18951.1 hypothetical protein Kpol_2002p21 [Vanderwaltozyma polyspora DSM 70294]
METQAVKTIRDELRELENTVAQASDMVLSEQDHRNASAIREMTQSVIAMSKENSLISVSNEIDYNEEIGNLAIDPSLIDEKIKQSNNFVELLKLTHLEQEALDYFLRYTISSTNTLELESTSDPKFVSLENEVTELENKTLTEHRDKIQEAKKDISDKSKDLANKQDQINELCLGAANSVDECWKMLNELEDIHSQRDNDVKETLSQDTTTTSDLIEETYKEWSSLQTSLTELNNSKDELDQLIAFKNEKHKDNDSTKIRNANIKNKTITENVKMLKLLINFWESNFIVPGSKKSKLSNLEVYPQTKKFQFKCAEQYTVIIQLNQNGGSIKSIEIFENDGKSVQENKNLSSLILNKYKNPLSSYPIFQVINDIVEELK